MSSNEDVFIHLFAGGCAGTLGAIITCPLEVVKTRLQSSTFSVMALPPPAACSKASTTCSTISKRYLSTSAIVRSQLILSQQLTSMPNPPNGTPPKQLTLRHCLRYIFQVEGPMALWRGLGPNLVGVAPARAIYFCTYSQMRKVLTTKLDFKEGPLVHLISAFCAGFSSSTATNPIWFVKTRLQIDHQMMGKKVRAGECIRKVYNTHGVLGFYKGMSASYYGISETVIHFVIYEAIKVKLQSYRQCNYDNNKTTLDFFQFMLAGAISKTIASCLCYPHEVARTRLREDGKKYRFFWQTLGLVFKEEGCPGLYRGFVTQLVRQIPNTAIVMGAYEVVAYYLSQYFNNGENEFYEDCDDD